MNKNIHADVPTSVIPISIRFVYACNAFSKEKMRLCSEEVSDRRFSQGLEQLN